MINIQLFGGPGTGKSTTAAGLFYKMKSNDMQVEYIQEFAKELTFSRDYTRLSDQLLILGEQHHRMRRLENQVEFLIHDSPFIMGLTYLDNDPHLPKDKYIDLIAGMYNTYNNINIFIERNETHSYQEYGRSQSFEEAIKKEEEIKNMLDEQGIKYITLDMGPNLVGEIYSVVKRK